jgi:hypothetical protein
MNLLALVAGYSRISVVIFRWATDLSKSSEVIIQNKLNVYTWWACHWRASDENVVILQKRNKETLG